MNLKNLFVAYLALQALMILPTGVNMLKSNPTGNTTTIFTWVLLAGLVLYVYKHISALRALGRSIVRFPLTVVRFVLPRRHPARMIDRAITSRRTPRPVY